MACEQSRRKFFADATISGSAAAIAAFGTAALAATALQQIYQTASARRDYPAAEAQAATRLLFLEMRQRGLNPLPHAAKSGLPKPHAQQGYAAVLRTLQALRAGASLPQLAAQVQQRMRLHDAPAGSRASPPSRPEHWVPFQIGEIPGDRLVGPMPANHIFQEYLLSQNRLLTVGYEDYALVDADGPMGSTFSLHEGGRLHAYVYVSWDVLQIVLNQPGMVVDTDRGDEHFSYLATIQPDGSYRIDHWGTQNDATIILAPEEVAYIQQEISRVVPLPPSPGALPGVHVRQPEPSEMPDHCRYCEELRTDCSCDCFTCGESRTVCSCPVKDEQDAVRVPPHDERDAYGRRLNHYGRPVRPFDGEATVSRGYVASTAPIITVRYDAYVFRGGTWQNILLHLAAYKDRAAQDQCDVEVGDILAVATIAEPNRPGEQIFTSGNPDYWQRIAWDAHGVTIQESSPFKHNTGRILIPWEEWSTLLEGVREFECWGASGEKL